MSQTRRQLASKGRDDKGGDGKDKEDRCSDCSKVVLDKEHGLQCEVCDFWYHSKCQKIDDDTYKLLSSGANNAIHWYCTSCNKGVAKLLQAMSKMQARQDRMDDDLKQVKDNVALIKDELDRVGDLARTTDTKLETLIEAKLVEGFDKKFGTSVDSKVKIMKEDVAESLEIEKRKNNIVFHGVKEADVVSLESLELNDFGKTADQEMIEEVLKTGLRLDASRHIEEVYRIGKYVAGKTRPLRVRIRTFEARNEILKRARDLKDCTEFKRIYIAPDLTRKQQEFDKDLRDHVKKFRDEGHQNVKIKSGKVVKNGTGNQVVILYQPPIEIKF
jgi:PHD-finger